MRIRLTVAVAALAAFVTPALAQAPGGGAPQDPAARFAAADTNKDGAVTKAEWTAAGRPEQAFARIDANGDGKITLAEMAAAPARGGPPPAGN